MAVKGRSGLATDIATKLADNVTGDISELDIRQTHTDTNDSSFNLTDDDLDDIAAGVTNKHFTSAEQSKLAGIEAGATADQTGAEIKSAYEAEANTNAYTDAEKTKLAGIESGATADQSAAEVSYSNATSGLTATDVQAALDEIEGRVDTNDAKVSNVSTNLSIGTTTSTTLDINSSDGTNATIPAAIATTAAGLLTGADKAKLDGIEAGATADQTGAEIKSAYEGEANTNAFTDAEKTKLTGIETSAEVNDKAQTLNTEQNLKYVSGVAVSVTAQTEPTTTDCNCPDGDWFYCTVDKAITLAFTNPPASGRTFGFVLELIKDATATARTITYPASVKWHDGTALSSLTASSQKAKISLSTRDGGTTWDAIIISDNYQ